MNTNNKYYIVVTEWLYPTESGRDIVDDFDTFDEALDRCAKIVFNERENYFDTTKTTPTFLNLNSNENGYIITDKNGLEDWWFQAKVIEVKYGI
jgi:hypothetical protein